MKKNIKDSIKPKVDEGNTSLHQLLKIRSRRWCLTLNNYSEEEFYTLDTLLSKENFYILGKEISESKTPHIQGYVEYKNAKSLSSLKKINDKIHWEKAKGSRVDNYIYCSKENNFTTNIILNTKVIDPLKDLELYPWQKKIIDIVNGEPDKRKIHWFYDEIGNKGKTTLAKHLCLKYPNNVLFVGGKGSDIKYAVYEFLKKNDLKTCIFHFTRSVENYISYEALESIKDGIFFNTKYESGMCVFNICHVICLANFKPDEDMLSKDRWDINILT